VTLSVQTTPRAEAQIREIDEWWRTNRPAAPDLFLNELTESFELIASTPHIGRRYPQSPVSGTRRLLLGSTRYHVYYISTEREIFILAVWHARRGEGPPWRTSI